MSDLTREELVNALDEVATEGLAHHSDQDNVVARTAQRIADKLRLDYSMTGVSNSDIANQNANVKGTRHEREEDEDPFANPAHAAIYAKVVGKGTPKSAHERMVEALREEFAGWVAQHPNAPLFDWDVAAQNIMRATPVDRLRRVLGVVLVHLGEDHPAYVPLYQVLHEDEPADSPVWDPIGSPSPPLGEGS